MISTFLRFSGGAPVVLFMAFAGALWVGAGYQPQDAFWLRPAAVVIAVLAIGRVVISIPRSLRAVRARSEGLPASARVEEVEKRRSTSNGGSRHLATRVRFTLTLNGTRYEGRTPWGSPDRTGLLAPGAEIDVRYLPEHPEDAFWVEDLVGWGRSRRMSQSDYEELFDGGPGSGRSPERRELP